MGDIKNRAGCLSSTCCVWVIPGRERAGGPRTQAARLRRQIGSPASSTKCFITGGAWAQGRRYGAESSGCLRAPVRWRRSHLFQNDGKSSQNCLKIYQFPFLIFFKSQNGLKSSSQWKQCGFQADLSHFSVSCGTQWLFFLLAWENDSRPASVTAVVNSLFIFRYFQKRQLLLLGDLWCNSAASRGINCVFRKLKL